MPCTPSPTLTHCTSPWPTRPTRSAARSAAESYLDIAKILKAAADSGADAVHPGYGFLAENAHFASEVIAAGLTWIGPPPAAIDALGDKTAARAIARSVGAPLAPGTQGPVAGPAEAAAFAREYGLPIAIKAAYGGGGRGLKVARTAEEIGQQFESAVREAVAAFGRGECFVERYLDRPRHVETQCLADTHGNIVVVSTRDCSLQRRHQKLVEEAPAPFLTAGAGAAAARLVQGDPARGRLRRRRDLRVPGRPGRHRVVPRGEHQAAGGAPGDRGGQRHRPGAGDVQDRRRAGARPSTTLTLRGHSIEFRINAEDPGRGFLPAPGTLAVWRPPSGPGVRLDAGYDAGHDRAAGYDSLIAKLVVTGADRPQALARARRALAEFEIGGMPTVLPFHRAVVRDPGVHRRAVLRAHPAGSRPSSSTRCRRTPANGRQAPPTASRLSRERIVVEVDGKRLEVVVPAGIGGGWCGRAGAGRRRRGGARAGRGRAGGRARRPAGGGGSAADGDALVSPMQGTIVKIVAAEGQQVAAGDTVVVLEAMKMEQPLTAHKDGTVADLTVAVGQTVSAGPGDLPPGGLSGGQAARRPGTGPLAGVRAGIPAARGERRLGPARADRRGLAAAYRRPAPGDHRARSACIVAVVLLTLCPRRSGWRP